MGKFWELGTVESVGGRRPGFVIVDYEMTSDPIAAGYSVSNKPNMIRIAWRGIRGAFSVQEGILDKSTKAMVFQNFQTPFKPQRVIQDYQNSVHGIKHPAILRAVFLLSEDIRRSTI